MHGEEGTSTEELHPSDGPLGMSVGRYFLFRVNGGEHSPFQVVPSLGRWIWAV